MLVSLDIKNVVLIEQLAIDFKGGFCALTGETGAGKSILLDSLGLALGGRSDAGLVRNGAEQAAVTAEFSVAGNHPVLAVLQKADIETEGGSVILRRMVGADGRSRAFINDRAVSVGLLKETGEKLVEIHGQFETQGLLDPGTHRALLDDYAGVNAKEIVTAWDAWKSALDDLNDARAAMEKARAEEAYLRQAVEDLDELSPEAGEEEKLASLRERLMRRGQVIDSLNTADAGLAESETALNTAFRALERAGGAGNILEMIDRATAELKEAQAAVQTMSTEFDESEHSQQEIDDRLFALRAMARRHMCAADDLPVKRDELARQLSLIEKQDDILSGLIKVADAKKAHYVAHCMKVSQVRAKAAEKLDKLVAKELPPLKLEKAKFMTQVAPLPEASWGPGGTDAVSFLVATNPGSAPGPLHKIASGGEMARFMLALKVVLAEQAGGADSLVFDEVDSGIGGATADAVGERLARLAKKRQILVVTHSPQVAARAASHFIVFKDGKKDVTTKIVSLHDMAQRREEIARMLAGAEITKEARAAADKLLKTGT